MNDQTAYYAIRAHFQMPGARLSKDSNGDCFYRCPYDISAETGNENDPRADEKCAFGVLIPDDIYDTLSETNGISLEGTSASEVAAQCSRLGYTLFDDLSTDFIDAIQEAHDGSASVRDFLRRMPEVADRFGIFNEAG